MTEFDDGDGYNSGFTANSEGTFQFNANSAMFDATTDNNSNEKIQKGTNSYVKVVAAARKAKSSILRGQRKK